MAFGIPKSLERLLLGDVVQPSERHTTKLTSNIKSWKTLFEEKRTEHMPRGCGGATSDADFDSEEKDGCPLSS